MIYLLYYLKYFYAAFPPDQGPQGNKPENILKIKQFS